MTPSPPIWSRGGIEMRWRVDEDGANILLYAGRTYIGLILAPDHESDLWGCGLFTEPGGRVVGNYTTEAEARTALVDAAVKALLGENDGG